ncbi:MAG: EAL domain-containing protein [Solirubrobacteraceae bacterium]
MLAHHDHGLATDLHAAVEAACRRPELVATVFQPIVDVSRATITGYEALTRFDLEPRMAPDRWFAAAERLGMGPRLEAVALRSALAHRHRLPRNCFLTVNLGPHALLAPVVREVLATAGDLRGVVIELTEQAPVEDYGALLTVLDPLRAAGVLLAVDDAGAGFASLKHITRLRPEFIKIDRGHVSGIDTDGTKVAVVQTLGDFASRMDAWVIAEGVETRAELDALAGFAVPLAQGYFLGRPDAAMTDVSAEATTAHRERTERETAGTIGPLLERAVCIPAAGAAAQALLGDPTLQTVVIVDEHGRPVRLAHRRGNRGTSPAMSIGLDADLPSLARRIVVRPEEVRFDPVVACDELGRAVGLLSVDRLMLALAESAAG